MSEDQTHVDLEKRLAVAAAGLCEHFDSVLILASHSRGGQTAGMTRGGGDWFAQYGLVMDWLSRAKARDTAAEIGQVFPVLPPDEGEDWKAEK